MKKVGILGTGAIGCILGGYLARGGVDATLISAYRRSVAETITEKGLYVEGIKGNFTVNIKAKFLDDLGADEKFDIVFVALKSNNLVDAVTRLAPHLAADGCIVTLENGINEELLTPIVGESRVLAGISFAGGKVLEVGRVRDHDGHFVIGELNGEITPRALEIVEILKNARPSQAVDNIRSWQWDKLAVVSMSVPAATVTGKYLGDVFTDEKCQKIFAHVALEAFKVAEADGCPKAEFSGKSAEHWQAVADGRISGLPSPDELIPGFPPEEVDAYTKDIRLGLDLEIGYTNGAIVRIGKQHGIPTPVNELLIQKVYDIAAGKATPGYALADEIIAAAK